MFRKTTPFMQNFLRIANGLIMLLWPFIIWAGVTQGLSFWLIPLFIAFFLLRLWLLKDHGGLQGQTDGQMYAGKALALTGIALCAASVLMRDHHVLMYYPVAVNLVLLILFGSSLFYGMPIVEQIARWREPDLPPQGVRYTRRVTQVWCLFFIINGSTALATCLYNDMKIWALWNGMLSYIFIGGVMGVEWLVRRRIKNR